MRIQNHTHINSEAHRLDLKQRLAWACMVVYLVRFKEIIADVVISFVVHIWLKFNMHVALYLVCRKQTEEVL